MLLSLPADDSLLPLAPPTEGMLWLHLGPTRICPLHLEATSVPMLRADDRLDPELADRFLQPGHLATEPYGAERVHFTCDVAGSG